MRKIALLALVFLCASIATPAVAAPAFGDCGSDAPVDRSQLPSTSAVVRFVNEWHATMNSADDTAYLRFMAERGPKMFGGQDDWLAMRDLLRGMTVCGVKSAKADAVELWVFDANLDSYGVWQFKPASPKADKIEFTGGFFTDDLPPGAAPAPRLALPALIEAVDERAASRAAKDEFSGAILVARNGRVLFEKAYGLADRELRKRNSLDTQFRFGSMGKMFTAVAIMQLVEQGKIELHAPVGRYLANYPNQDIATKVTVAPA